MLCIHTNHQLPPFTPSIHTLHSLSTPSTHIFYLLSVCLLSQLYSAPPIVHPPPHPRQRSIACGIQDILDNSVKEIARLNKEGLPHTAESMRRHYSENLFVGPGRFFLSNKDGVAFEVFKNDSKPWTSYPAGFNPKYNPTAPVRNRHSKPQR